MFWNRRGRYSSDAVRPHFFAQDPELQQLCVVISYSLQPLQIALRAKPENGEAAVRFPNPVRNFSPAAPEQAYSSLGALLQSLCSNVT